MGKNTLSVDGVSLSDFNYLNSLGTRIADTLSTVLSVMTDNAKDPIAGKMPYLPSRRTIFYWYNSIKVLKDLWIKNHKKNLGNSCTKL